MLRDETGLGMLKDGRADRYSVARAASLNDRMTETDPMPATDLRMWLRLLTCAKIVEKRLRRNFQEQFDTTLPRFDVMAALERAPDGLTMGALSRALLVSNGNVTAIVRQLQMEGTLASAPDPQDKRSAIVSLTARGRTQFATLAAAHHGWISEVMRDFPVDQQGRLLALLTDLKSSLTET